MLEELRKRVDLGLIGARPNGRLTIFDYTNQCLFDRAWDDYTLQARGLVLDDQGQVVARPWGKFFNVNERPETKLEALPAETPELSEKMDGCFDGQAGVLLSNGKSARIKDIYALVNNGESVAVLSFDVKTNQVVSNFVTAVQCLENQKACLRLEFEASRGSRFGSEVICTEDHRFMTPNGWLQAKDLEAGSDVLRVTELLDVTSTNLLAGCLLGDASIKLNGSPLIQFSQAVEEYLDYKIKVLGALASKKTTYISGYGSRIWTFRTRSSQAFDDLYEKFIANGKAVVPKDVGEYLSDVAVAFLYMDDGSLTGTTPPNVRPRAALHVQGYSWDCAERLRSALTEKYGKTTLNDAKGPTIFLGVEASEKMFSAIAKYVHPSMRYKLPNEFRAVEFQEVKVTYKKGLTRRALISSNIIPKGKKKRYVYDLRVENSHTYFVSGNLVHNSMIITFFDTVESRWRGITRFCWENVQTKYANRWLEKNAGSLDPKNTYMFELIAPWNRLVLPYEKEEMILLGFRDTAAGTDVSYAQMTAAAAKMGLKAVKFETRPLSEISLEDPKVRDREGFVARYSNGLRVKLKYHQYMLLHKILTGLSVKGIWETLSTNNEPSFVNVPDEFMEWFRKQRDGLKKAYSEIEEKAKAAFSAVPPQPTRKDYAMAFQKTPELMPILFMMLDKYPYAEVIWDKIKPKGQTSTFQVNQE